MSASAALPRDDVAANQRYERSSNKRSNSRRFRVPALANGIVGLLVLPLLFVFLYGPDKFVEILSPGYMCNQSAPEALKAVRRDAVGILSFGDFYSTSAINLNVPASLLLSMETATILQHTGKQEASCPVRYSRLSIACKFLTMEIGLSKTYP